MINDSMHFINNVRLIIVYRGLMNIAQGLETITARLLHALGAAALLLSSSGVVLAATVSFTPDPQNVMAGDIFTVDIVGSDFTELAGGTINLGFDSSMLTVDSVVVNSALFDYLPDGGGPAVGNTWPDIGFDTFVNTPATGAFTVATMTLTAETEGSSSLTILGSSRIFQRHDPAITDADRWYGEYKCCTCSCCSCFVWLRPTGICRHSKAQESDLTVPCPNNSAKGKML